MIKIENRTMETGIFPNCSITNEKIVKYLWDSKINELGNQRISFRKALGVFILFYFFLYSGPTARPSCVLIFFAHACHSKILVLVAQDVAEVPSMRFRLVSTISFGTRTRDYRGQGQLAHFSQLSLVYGIHTNMSSSPETRALTHIYFIL